ncbi:MAG: acyltransferase [Oscillospiraceae bacterium]|nr:acyltransferase [Oscillospiraceae bacterium]
MIELGDNVRITNGVRFVTHDGGLWVLKNLGKIDSNVGKFGKIKIGSNTHIGWNAIIMPGVTIGKNCIIGCGAVVTKDIPDNSVAVGVPAKVIESIDDYYSKVLANHDIIDSSDYSAKMEYLRNKYMTE